MAVPLLFSGDSSTSFSSTFFSGPHYGHSVGGARHAYVSLPDVCLSQKCPPRLLTPPTSPQALPMTRTATLLGPRPAGLLLAARGRRGWSCLCHCPRGASAQSSSESATMPLAGRDPGSGAAMAARDLRHGIYATVRPGLPHKSSCKCHPAIRADGGAARAQRSVRRGSVPARTRAAGARARARARRGRPRARTAPAPARRPTPSGCGTTVVVQWYCASSTARPVTPSLSV